MAEIIEVLRERVKSEPDEEKNEIYYTPKQKRVLKTIAQNPHVTASEVADKAGVHPSYIPYIIERVDQGVVDNLHRLDEYLSEQEEMDDAKGSEVQQSGPDEKTTELMDAFGAGKSNQQKTASQQPTVDDHMVGPDATEFTVTKELPVEITIKFPDGEESIRKLIQAKPELGNVKAGELREAVSEEISKSTDESESGEDGEENEDALPV